MNISCVKPYLTAYDFMRYLCASLVLKQKTKIPMDDIVPKIYNYRISHNNCDRIFSDIEFRTGINDVVSNDIMESIGELQTFGVVGKENPKYINMLIFLTRESAAAILKDCPSEVSTVVDEIATSL